MRSRLFLLFIAEARGECPPCVFCAVCCRRASLCVGVGSVVVGCLEKSCFSLLRLLKSNIFKEMEFCSTHPAFRHDFHYFFQKIGREEEGESFIGQGLCYDKRKVITKKD